MTYLTESPHTRDGDQEGWVARLTAGGWTYYHRSGCTESRGATEPVRSVVRGPWRYLSHHWRPCPHCRPPMDGDSSAD